MLMATREPITRPAGYPDNEPADNTPRSTLDHPIRKRLVVEIESRCCICSVGTWNGATVCDACAVSPAL